MSRQQSNSGPGALHGIRVLELGHGVAGPFGARLLADLGADVIKVEKPGVGDFARGLDPLISKDGADDSLLFEYLNWNKRGLALDLGNRAAAPVLRRLVERSDIVIDSFRPGRLDAWGFGYEQLSAWNSSIVLTSVSNFGQSGELSQWQATDLIFYAMSGIMAISGKEYPNGPLKHGLRQSLFCAGLNVAYTSLAAFLLAQTSGIGDHVDLSIREVMSSTLTTATSYYGFMGGIPGRQPARQDPLSGDPVDTATGYLAIQTSRAAPPDRYADFLGLPQLNVPDFARPDYRVKHAEELRELFEKRLASENAIDMFLRANDAGLLVGLVQDARMLLESAHLAERDIWWTLPARPGEAPPPWRFPGELARFSRTPVTFQRRAPRLGQDTGAVLHEVGMSAEEVARLADAAAIGGVVTAMDAPVPDIKQVRLGDGDAPLWTRDPDRARTDRLPLAGLRVIDLSGIVAGPYMGGLLADLGADVIKIEGPQRPDTTRYAYGAFIDNDPGEHPWDRGGAYQILNRGKRSLVCDLATNAGQAVLRRLLADADVLVENFTPRVLPKWGLTQHALDELNPRLITVSNSGFGATGPWRNFRAQGTTLELTMGIAFQTGYAGGRPSKAGQSYPDFISCWSGLSALLTALVDRARTGRGQRIDQGMYQVGVALIPEALLHYQVYGEDLQRRGARDIGSVISDVYETVDDDVWVAVSVRGLDDARRLAAVVPALAGAVPPEGESNDAGLAAAGQAALTEWMRTRSWPEAVAELQRAGVPAAKVMSMDEVMTDRHLGFRGFYEDVDLEGDIGIRPLIGRPYQFRNSRAFGTGPRIGRRAPRYGEHNDEVLRNDAGLNESSIAELASSGVIGTRPTKEPIAKAMDVAALIRKGSFAGVDPDYRQHLADRPRGRVD